MEMIMTVLVFVFPLFVLLVFVFSFFVSWICLFFVFSARRQLITNFSARDFFGRKIKNPLACEWVGIFPLLL